MRNQEEILVVLGNPPYRGKSDNPSKDIKGNLTFIGKLIETYKMADGLQIRDRGGRATFDLGPGLGVKLRPDVLSRPDLSQRISDEKSP